MWDGFDLYVGKSVAFRVESDVWMLFSLYYESFIIFFLVQKNIRYDERFVLQYE